MARTTMCARSPEELRKAIDNLKEGCKKQSKIIKEKEATIKQLTGEVISLTYELKKMQWKYEALMEQIK